MAILLLQHEHAQEFFERALHPDREELRERDEYFARLSEMFGSVTDADEMEFEIPDIDVVFPVQSHILTILTDMTLPIARPE